MDVYDISVFSWVVDVNPVIISNNFNFDYVFLKQFQDS